MPTGSFRAGLTLQPGEDGTRSAAQPVGWVKASLKNEGGDILGALVGVLTVSLEGEGGEAGVGF